jgi:hypothetical protein
MNTPRLDELLDDVAPSRTTAWRAPPRLHSVPNIAPESELASTIPFVRVDDVPEDVTAVAEQLARAESVVTRLPVAETTPEQEWAEFKRIGLGPKTKLSAGFGKLIVAAYRMLGFAILTAIVVALVGYLATTGFYMVSTSWVVPTIVSPTDDKVVALKSELATQQNERDRIARELADSERAMAAEQSFQDKFAAAIASDRDGRRSALHRTRALAGAAAQTRAEIRATSDAFAQDASARMTEQYGAGMIDRHDMLDGKHQLAQISSANLSLAERQAAFETESSELARQADALDALLSDGDAPLSYDALKIKRDLETSRVALAKSVAVRDSLRASLARQDALLAGLRSSAYLRAVTNGATVALVPYANLERATPGARLYACRLAMVWCHEVGTVVQVLPGEVQLRHPHKDALVRGQMIELHLTDAEAARDNVLFAGGKPLGL